MRISDISDSTPVPLGGRSRIHVGEYDFVTVSGVVIGEIVGSHTEPQKLYLQSVGARITSWLRTFERKANVGRIGAHGKGWDGAIRSLFVLKVSDDTCMELWLG